MRHRIGARSIARLVAQVQNRGIISAKKINFPAVRKRPGCL